MLLVAWRLDFLEWFYIAFHEVAWQMAILVFEVLFDFEHRVLLIIYPNWFLQPFLKKETKSTFRCIDFSVELGKNLESGYSGLWRQFQKKQIFSVGGVPLQRKSLTKEKLNTQKASSSSFTCRCQSFELCQSHRKVCRPPPPSWPFF